MHRAYQASFEDSKRQESIELVLGQHAGLSGFLPCLKQRISTQQAASGGGSSGGYPAAPRPLAKVIIHNSSSDQGSTQEATAAAAATAVAAAVADSAGPAAAAAIITGPADLDDDPTALLDALIASEGGEGKPSVKDPAAAKKK